MSDRPIPSPESALEVANIHQEAYEAVKSTAANVPSRQDMHEMLHHSTMVENNALLAIAGFLAQQHICNHGVRGWCPSCHLALKEGTYTG